MNAKQARAKSDFVCKQLALLEQHIMASIQKATDHGEYEAVIRKEELLNFGGPVTEEAMQTKLQQLGYRILPERYPNAIVISWAINHIRNAWL